MLIQAYSQYDRTQAPPPWPRESEQTGLRVALKREKGSMKNGVARYFTGTSFQIGPVWIGITGTQDYRGEVTRQTIVIDLPRGIADLDVDRARKLGEAALALADELEALSGGKSLPA
jgi:hypothetical protein